MPRILLVEDDDQLRTMLKLLLTNSGYEVWEACNGERVSQICQQCHPDLVITDLLMPEKEGLEVILELRRRDRNVKIIAMSGGWKGSAESYLPLARKFGAQYTLAKPFSHEEFLKVVQLALEPEV